MLQLNWERARWRKSVRCAGANNCVEYAVIDGMVAVRDSQDHQGAVLVFSAAAWRLFVEAIKGADLGP